MRRLRNVTEPRVLSPSEVETIVSALAAGCPSLPIVLLYLHGSHATGTQGPLSDLDLGVLLVQPAAREVDVQLRVIDFFEGTCRREDVDVAFLHNCGPIIKDRVVRHGRLVYARSDRERILFEEAAIKTALDFRHFSRVYDRALFEQVAEGRFLGG